jgi:RNA-directed DNA polymerase
VQDRVNFDIGAPEPELDWNSIDWSKAHRKVKNLRQRIYRATQQGQWKQVRNLQKLMLRSYSNLLVSTRRVTQDNQGKKTPGVDGQKALTPQARAKVVREMQSYQIWQVKPTKRIYIPKANGKLRPLSIPTIKDRIAQNMVKNALEPHWEYQFEANSYGFRPGRSCHDAIEQCWTRLNANGSDEWILDADLAGAFDNIVHQFIEKAIGNSPGRGWIKAWLKAGYLEQTSYHPTLSGTPQGGVVSPLLLNVAGRLCGRKSTIT